MPQTIHQKLTDALKMAKALAAEDGAGPMFLVRYDVIYQIVTSVVEREREGQYWSDYLKSREGRANEQ